MKIKSILAKPFAKIVHLQLQKSKNNALQDQEKIFQHLIEVGKKTLFGTDHNFNAINSYDEFTQNVLVKDYEGLKDYIELTKAGKANVLWKGLPYYFAKTSGTTSGMKYIPITKDSMPNHINTARNALLNYMAESGNTAFADGKMIFLSGSPELERVGNVPFGRLSGIVNHHVPKYLRKNQLPSYSTNCIEDWETKLDAIVKETIEQNMTLISGIPPWMQMYFDRLVEIKGKKVKKIFPNFSVLVYGGVNFSPYRTKLFDTIGEHVDSIETFPASEGFFAFQDKLNDPGLLLNTNGGIFYEFIPLNEVHNPQPKRVSLKDVQLGENYALIINSNAGLWGYNIGDVVKFVSLDPYKILVTGRVKHFISAFGEHVIAEEVEKAMATVAPKYSARTSEFTVAPMVQQGEGKSYHEWFVEFEVAPTNIKEFALDLDHEMRKLNVYYDDLVAGNILMPLKLTCVQKNSFIEYMKSEGKLGGQNKLPRLSNDRKIASFLEKKELT
jgi:hypothetical protein